MNIFLTGDCALGRSTLKFGTDIWGKAEFFMKASDLCIINLETTITKHNISYPKVFNYKMNPKHLNVLEHVDHANIANNHILDFYEKGMIDTIENLKKIGITYAGAGMDLDEARRPVVKKIKGIKVMIFGASDHYDYWAASDDSPGIWYINPTDSDDALQYIKKEIDNHNPEIVIFSIHLGPNHVYQISPIIKQFTRKLIKTGVDIVHGHSAHHLLPMEQITIDGKKGIIFYSLGDFIDDYEHRSHPELRTNLSVGAIVTYKNGKFTVNHVPFNHDNYKIKLANREERRWVKSKLKNPYQL